jgi:hypothetical protein
LLELKPAPPPVRDSLWACLGDDDPTFSITALPAAERHMLDACIARARADMQPATADHIDQAIVVLGGLQISQKQGVSAAALGAAYHVGLDDVPADLLALAVRHALKNSTFRPMPAELRKFVQAEMATRERRLRRLEASSQPETNRRPLF